MPRRGRQGPGPVAPALKTPPVDLTLLSKTTMENSPIRTSSPCWRLARRLPSHGSAEMPVWGPILGKMNQSNPQDRLLRISNLSRYLESIQVK
jgi:hypothetical protein